MRDVLLLRNNEGARIYEGWGAERSKEQARGEKDGRGGQVGEWAESKTDERGKGPA